MHASCPRAAAASAPARTSLPRRPPRPPPLGRAAATPTPSRCGLAAACRRQPWAAAAAALHCSVRLRRQPASHVCARLHPAHRHPPLPPASACLPCQVRVQAYLDDGVLTPDEVSTCSQAQLEFLIRSVQPGGAALYRRQQPRCSTPLLSIQPRPCSAQGCTPAARTAAARQPAAAAAQPAHVPRLPSRPPACLPQQAHRRQPCGPSSGQCGAGAAPRPLLLALGPRQRLGLLAAGGELSWVPGRLAGREALPEAAPGPAEPCTRLPHR